MNYFTPFSCRRNIANRSLHSFIPLILSVMPKTRYGKSTEVNHSFRIQLVISIFHSNRFFPIGAISLNRLPRGWFPEFYNLNLFKSIVNLPTYPLKPTSDLLLLPLTQQRISGTLYLDCLLGLV